ncbi:START domain-containing protein [Lacimicrobium alkaliphilum]|nr:START domain-containing protein [Lacimicrobium alkaliphilum]
MQFSLLLTLLCCALFIEAACLTPSQGWEERKADENVEVYARRAGNSFEILAITRVKSAPEAFLTLLRDTEKAPEWIHSARQVTLLEQPKANEDLVHTIFNAPWPVKDRDMVTLSRIVSAPDDSELRIEISDASDRHPVTPETVRMLNVNGLWRLLPQQDHTLICYQGSGDAAGNIPRWLSRSLLVSGTYKTFNNLADKLGQTETVKK